MNAVTLRTRLTPVALNILKILSCMLPYMVGIHLFAQVRISENL